MFFRRLGSAVALSGLLMACGGGESLVDQIVARAAGLWETNMAVENPGIRIIAFTHPDGWEVFDMSVDGGETWCRRYADWFIPEADAKSTDNFVKDKVFTYATCGSQIGDRMPLEYLMQSNDQFRFITPGTDPNDPAEPFFDNKRCAPGTDITLSGEECAEFPDLKTGELWKTKGGAPAFKRTP